MTRPEILLVANINNHGALSIHQAHQIGWRYGRTALLSLINEESDEQKHEYADKDEVIANKLKYLFDQGAITAENKVAQYTQIVNICPLLFNGMLLSGTIALYLTD